ncbi:MAG: regulatory protein RecX [Magnetococcales bacterium]|nr:regulatory protein RecX [Magnetococcales bacterium]
MDPAAVDALALKLLAQRPHSVQELRRKLRRKGIDALVIEQTIARCQGWGYLDDAAFADTLVRSRVHNRRWGPERLRADLQGRGVAADQVESALKALRSTTDLVALARAARDKRFGATPPADRATLKRQYDFLVRRGFDADTIWQVLG